MSYEQLHNELEYHAAHVPYKCFQKINNNFNRDAEGMPNMGGGSSG